MRWAAIFCIIALEINFIERIMRYTIKLSGSQRYDGKISFNDLASLARQMDKLAYSALHVRLYGIGYPGGRRFANLESAIQMHLSGFEKGSTVLVCEAESMIKAMPQQQQLSLFEKAKLKEEDTPLSLCIEAIEDVQKAKKNSKYLNLIPHIAELNLLLNKGESLIIQNQRADKKVQLDDTSIKRLKALQKHVPKPEDMFLQGELDEVKLKHNTVKIRTQQGAKDLLIKGIVDGELLERIGQYTLKEVKEVLARGEAYYKPNGSIRIMWIKHIAPAVEKDRFISKVSEQKPLKQLLKELKEKSSSENQKKWVGKWPGPESLEELQDKLDKIRAK